MSFEAQEKQSKPMYSSPKGPKESDRIMDIVASLKPRRLVTGLACIGLTATTLIASPASATAFSATPNTSPQVTNLAAPVEVLASAPRYITGYTDHCELRLKQRNISKGHAESVVENNWRKAYKDREHGTWQYQDKTILVSLNNNGACVTVKRL